VTKANVVYKVLIPLEVVSSRLTGSLFGYFHEESAVFNVTRCGV
jgi:hypothetical protein